MTKTTTPLDTSNPLPRSGGTENRTMDDAFVTPDGVIQAMSPDDVFAYLAEVVSLGDAARSSVMALLEQRGFSKTEVDLILTGASIATTGMILEEELFNNEVFSTYIRTMVKTAEVHDIALSPEQVLHFIVQFHVQLCISFRDGIHPNETLEALKKKLKRGFGK